jgi:hypothetical protein
MLARILRCSAVAEVAGSGTPLAWRSVNRPFQLTSVSSPVNAQSVFGLSVTILLLLNTQAEVSANRKARLLPYCGRLFRSLSCLMTTHWHGTVGP